MNFASKYYQTSMYGSGMRTLNIEKAKQRIVSVLTEKNVIPIKNGLKHDAATISGMRVMW